MEILLYVLAGLISGMIAGSLLGGAIASILNIWSNDLGERGLRRKVCVFWYLVRRVYRLLLGFYSGFYEPSCRSVLELQTIITTLTFRQIACLNYCWLIL